MEPEKDIFEQWGEDRLKTPWIVEICTWDFELTK